MQPPFRIFLALLLTGLAACSELPPPAAGTPLPPTAGANDPIEEQPPGGGICEPSIHPFWKKFRAAVLKEDMAALASMTEFPLVLFQSSSSSKKLVSRQEFAGQFPQLLKTAKAVLRKNPTLEKAACWPQTDYLFFKILLEFSLTPDGWRFTGMGVDEFPASMDHLPAHRVFAPKPQD